MSFLFDLWSAREIAIEFVKQAGLLQSMGSGRRDLTQHLEAQHDLKRTSKKLRAAIDKLERSWSQHD